MSAIRTLGFAMLLAIGGTSIGAESGPSEYTTDHSDAVGSALLQRISHLPSVLPVILQNGDALEMTDEQLEAFRRWRKRNYQRMVGVMNDIIRKRIAISQGALNPSLGGEQLIAYQDEIFRLQRELLLIRLSCRELLISVFNDRQWENLAFLAEDHPQLAGLVHAPTAHHSH